MAMLIRVDKDTYEADKLPLLGTGSFGEIRDLGGSLAAKLYFDKPTDEATRKLIKLFDIGTSLSTDPQSEYTLSLPAALAIDVADDAVAGFSMTCLRNWVPLSTLGFRWRAGGEYDSEAGFRFDDASAVRAAFSLFRALSALERRHIAIGDISAANILVDPRNGAPGFIDMDSVRLEDWESESLGTEGYVDPHVLDSDLNSMGGYPFDARSDVFALTVVIFYLFTGKQPYVFGLNPPRSVEDLAKLRISNFRVLVEGEGCLKAHGLSLTSSTDITELKSRIEALRRVPGKTGSDGEVLYQHFVSVFIRDERENPVESLPENDARNPTYAISATLKALRAEETLADMDRKYGINRASAVQPKAASISIPRIARRNKPYLDGDPSAFGAFLRTRGIDYSALVA